MATEAVPQGAPRTASTGTSRLRQSLRLRNAGVVYALALLVAILTVVTIMTGRPTYISGRNIANVLDQASLIAILAVFMTVVLISGNFDLSVGSVAALSASVLLVLIDQQGFLVAFIAAVSAGTAVGLINGVIVQFVGINAFIVTLGTLTAVRGLVLILTDARTITAREPAARDALRALESGRWTTPDVLLVLAAVLITIAVVAVLLRRPRSVRGWPLPMLVAGGILLLAGIVTDWQWRLAKPVYYMIAITLVASLLLRFTVLGRRLYATGGNAEAARLSGINVTRYKTLAFVLNGAAAGFVGVLFGAKLGAINPTGLQGVELTVLAAAILGGTSLFGGSGSIVKSVVGTLILFSLANGFNVLNLGATYQGLIEGAVIIVAAAVYTLASRERRFTADVPSGPAATPPEPTGSSAGAASKVNP